MYITADRQHGSHRDMDEVVALAQEAAIFIMVFSAVVIVLAIIALAFAF